MKVSLMKGCSKWNSIRKSAKSESQRLGMTKGFRSGLEVRVTKILEDSGVNYEYETLKIEWTPLPSKHKYTPDHTIITQSGKMLILETKGRFMGDDMLKHLAVKIQHPHLDIRFIFQNSKSWHHKAKTKSYAMWCEQYGFKYCDFKDFKETLKKWRKE